ncbi:MAG: hypothetical protein ACF8MF_13400 [Phycisphaerales bacterium JB052]
MRSVLTYTCVAAMGFGSTAMAQQLTPVVDNRNMYFEAQVNAELGADQAQDFYSATDIIFNPFDPWSYSFGVSAEFQAANANTNGTIDSVIGATSITASGTAYGFAQVLDPTAYDAFGSTSSIMEVGFSLDQASTWEIIASLAADAGSTAEFTLSHGLTPGGTTVFSSTDAMINELVFLDAGDYTLTVYATATASVSSIATAESNASFDAQFNLVPAPATGTLAMLGLAFASRRRRNA